jgi:acetyl esterase/lipase
MRFASLAVAVVSLMRCSGQARLNADDILRLASEAPLAKVPYGYAPQQYAELRMPQGKGPFPVVAVIHGGCWIQYATTAYTAHLASALVKEGWATWNVEYRGAHEPGGGWPGTFLDAGRAVDALREAARTYPLDLGRVIAMGHSAGGQLALWVAGRGRIPRAGELHTDNPLPLRGVVSLAGIADMRAYADGGPKDCVAGELRVMGGTPAQQPARYSAASPIELLPLGTPQVLVWGEEDSIVPERLFEDYEKRAKQAGDSVEIVRVKNAGHHELCSAEGAGWKQIVDAVRRLFG